MRIARPAGPVIVLLLVGLVMGGSVAALNVGNPEGGPIPQAPAAMVIPTSPLAPTPDPNKGTAPRLWDFAVVDGNCDDPVYTQAGSVVMRDAQGTGSTDVKLFHSGSDLYLCTDDMPPGDGQRLFILVDADASRGQLPIPGDYAFVIPIAGDVQVMQGSLNGSFVAITVPPQDVQAVVGIGAGKTWRAEARISLEWLGGYARVDGFDLALVGAGESVLQQWPQSANYLSPLTWGELTLAPVYGVVSAGSVFLDGLDNYVVVPYTPDLNPNQVTIEAWVKPMEGTCGTLVGNGRASSYWAGLCRALKFGYGGETTIFDGISSVGPGWHHVAFTMDLEGARTYYLDGNVDARPGWEPPHEKIRGAPEQEARLRVSDRMLRIGSDRDAPSGADLFHGYLRELRIWNQERTADEIRANAFKRLTGLEKGLVGLWPFSGGLQDIAGGHDAGLVGSASLSRESLDVVGFPQSPISPPYAYPAPTPIPSWGARIPVISATVAVDGVCGMDEYEQAASVTLEPNRASSMRAMLNADALYLCTNILFGQTGGTDEVVVLIDGSGKGGAVTGQSHIRLRLAPDGKLSAATGDGTGFSGAPPAGLVATTVTGPQFGFQEDIVTLNAPWWAGEMRIPLKALAPFQSGGQLRLALGYSGSVPANAVPQQPFTGLQGSWPASYAESKPDTWGIVSTGPLTAATSGQMGMIVGGRSVIEPQPRQVTTDPRVPPSVADFYAKCPGSPGDPRWSGASTAERAVLFASYAAAAFDRERKWPMVDPAAFPIVQAEGRLNEAAVSSIDSPFIHGSHDLDMPLSARPGDRWIGLDGSPVQVLETESGGIPPSRSATPMARPTVGDHVTVKGRWIFDCGHEPKTEIHPDYYIESDRIENRPIWPGGSLHPVRIVRVWVNSNPGGFARDLTGELSSFDFDADFPGSVGSWMPFVRLVSGQSDRIAWSSDSTSAHFTVTPPATTGQYYFELMLGHLIQEDEPSTRDSGTYTIAFDRIDILNDRDAGLPDCDFVLFVPTSDCGEWYMSVNVNGAWRQIFWNTSVLDDPGENTISLTHIAPITTVGREIDFQVSAYDDDAPLDGELVTSCRFNCVGPPTALRSLLGPQVLAPVGGDWRLAYTVTAGGEAPSTLVEESYWAPRMAGETGLGGALDLGVIPVSARGTPPTETLQAATFIEQPLTRPLPDGSFIRLAGDDVDQYVFTLSDLATLEVDSPTPGARLRVFETYPVGWPEEVRRAMGPTGASVTAVSDPALRTGEMPYTLRIRTSYRDLLPDWGEVSDFPSPGRLADLRTPDPRVGIRARHIIDNAATGIFEAWPEVRDLTMDWAWQHVAGDVDDYLIRIPPLSSGPGCDVDRTDRPGQLSLSAQGMRMRIPALGIDTRGAVDIDAGALFPLGGDILLHVENDPGRRGVYHLVTRWTDALRLTADECSRARAARARAEEMASILTTWDEARAIAHMFGVGFGHEETPGELALTPRCPGALPASATGRSGLLQIPLALTDRRCWAMADAGMWIEAGGLLDIMIASPPGKLVRARLYGLDGVMLGESLPSVDSFGQPSAASAPGPGDPAQRGRATSPSVTQIQIPDGLTQQSRLRVDGVTTGNLYLLRIVPDFQVDPADTTATPVAISDMGRAAFRRFLPFIARGQ